MRVAACRCGFAAIGSRQSSSPAALGYEIAGDTLKKVGRGLTWTLGLQDIDEHNLRAMRRLDKRILGQMIAIWSYRNRCDGGRALPAHERWCVRPCQHKR